MENKIKSFTDLLAWQKSHKFILEIYRLTNSFPDEEKFGLTNQIRRAAVSVSSNLAEGFSRNGQREKSQFYFTALGSLTETQNQLLISRDLGYLNKTAFTKLAEETIEISKLINGLIKSITKINRNKPLIHNT